MELPSSTAAPYHRPGGWGQVVAARVRVLARICVLEDSFVAGICWLASYPKSGNTWLRAFLANLFSGPEPAEHPVPINDLSKFCIADDFYGDYARCAETTADRLSEPELLRLRLALERFTGSHPSDALLLECVKREEAADATLGLLLAGRRTLALSNQDFYRLVRSREYLPAEGFTQLAEAALEDQAPEPSQAPGVLLSGIVPEPAGLLTVRSEERRVGKECRSRWSPYH